MRYEIDQRVGCIAVVDTEVKSNSDGLHPDTPGVAKYWHGYQDIITCKECGHIKPSDWKIEDSDIKEAKELVEKLNKEEK